MEIIFLMQKPLEAIQIWSFDEDEDDQVYDFFYDHMPFKIYENGSMGPSYKKWRLSCPTMGTLYRLANQLLSDLQDKNYYHLFDMNSILHCKSS